MLTLCEQCVFVFRVHPRYKEEIAERLYLGALDVVYQTPTVFQGPFPQSVESKGNLVHINYSSTVSVQKSGSEPGINFEVSSVKPLPF